MRTALIFFLAALHDLYGYWDDEYEKTFHYNMDGSSVSTQKTTAYPAISLGLKIGFGFAR